MNTTQPRRNFLSLLSIALALPSLPAFLVAWWIGDTRGLTLDERFLALFSLLGAALLGLIAAVLAIFALIFERRRTFALIGLVAGAAPTLTVTAMMAYLGEGPFAR